MIHCGVACRIQELFVANLLGTPLIGEFNLGPDGSAYFPQRCLTWVSAIATVGRDGTSCSNVVVSSFVPSSTISPTPTAFSPTIVPPTIAPPTATPTSPTATSTPQPTAPLPPLAAVKKVVYINYRDVNWNDPGVTVRAAVQAGYNVVILAFWLRTGTQTRGFTVSPLQ